MSHYVRARHYSYVTGCWSTVDPLWPDESAYGYVSGQSLFWIDPTGWQKGGGGGRGGSGTIPRTTPPNTSKPPSWFPKSTGNGNGNGTGIGPKPGVGPRPGGGGSPPAPGGNPGPSDGESAIICGMLGGDPISCMFYLCMPKPQPKQQPRPTLLDYNQCVEMNEKIHRKGGGCDGNSKCPKYPYCVYWVEEFVKECLEPRNYQLYCDHLRPPGPIRPWEPNPNHLTELCKSLDKLLKCNDSRCYEHDRPFIELIKLKCGGVKR